MKDVLILRKCILTLGANFMPKIEHLKDFIEYCLIHEQVKVFRLLMPTF